MQANKWDLKLNDPELSLLRWNKHNLTYFGKSIVMNTLIIPKLVCNITVLHVPNDIVKRIEKLTFSFLWGKVHKIKKNTVIGKYHQGRLNIMNIESKIMSLKISWLSRLTAENKVSDLFDLYLRQSGLKINTILRMNFIDVKEFWICGKE